MQQREVGVEGWVAGVSPRGLVLFENRDKENTPNPGDLRKAPPFGGENNAGPAVWAGGDRRRETEARGLGPAAAGRQGQGTSAHADPAPRDPAGGESEFLRKALPRSPRQAPRRWGPRRHRAGGEAPSSPGAPEALGPETSPGATTRGRRGAGSGRAPTRAFHARCNSLYQVGFVWAPFPLAPGKQQRSRPQKGGGRGGEAEAETAKALRSPARRVSAGGRRAPGAALH